MTRAILLLALCCMGCATARQSATPEIPRIRCINVAALPMAEGWWLYACEFRGDSVPPVLAPPVTALEGS